MIVGFTGTRQGMTVRQKEDVTDMLSVLGVTEAHHGDCIGSDEEFHNICLAFGFNVVIHPPTDSKYRAWCAGSETVLILPPKPYLVRNTDIVDASEILISTPRQAEQPRSLRGEGTWSTITYGRKQGKRVVVNKP